MVMRSGWNDIYQDRKVMESGLEMDFWQLAFGADGLYDISMFYHVESNMMLKKARSHSMCPNTTKQLRCMFYCYAYVNQWVVMVIYV